MSAMKNIGHTEDEIMSEPPSGIVEKTKHPSTDVPHEEGLENNVSWTAEEEKRLVRKIDKVILSILTFCFFNFQLDRANIGNALTDNFLHDVGITQNQFNVGQQHLNAGIVLPEIPSNIILYRVGPKIWIGCQVILWGSLALFQAWQKGLGAYLATRLLLGLFESGFIPGSLYVMSMWYKNSEISRRFGFFFLGNGIAQACGGLLAYAILHMRGFGGMAGWQWLFILEGLLTVISGVIFLLFFPGLPDNPISLIGISYFNEREIAILRQRIILDDSSKASKKRTISGHVILETLRDKRIWPHILITISGLAPTTALWSYAPTIVSSFGYGRLQANALVSVGQWISVCLIVVAAYVADKTGRRGFVVLFGVSCQWTFMVAFKSLPDDTKAGIKFGILTMGTATCSWWHSVHGSWLSINSRSREQRAVRMALFIMSANCAGIVGSQLFRSDDRPFYHRGWSIIVALMSLTLSLVVNLIWSYWVSNRSSESRDPDQATDSKVEVDPNSSEQETSHRHYNF